MPYCDPCVVRRERAWAACRHSISGVKKLFREKSYWTGIREFLGLLSVIVVQI